jgi:YD repeat-containing protein
VIKNTSSGVTLASFDLGYDLAGNVTSKASSVFANAANGTWSYTYDGASRLTKATGPSGTGQTSTWDYAYDGAGNRTLLKQTVGSTVTKNLTTTYGVGGLPTSATDAATGESITYTHDEIGDLTLVDSSIGTNDWSYTYDAWGRTTCAKQAPTCASGSGQVSWKLDAFDRTFTRSATAGSKTTVTTPTYRGIGEQLAKLVEVSTTTLELASPSGIPMGEKVGSGSPRFFLADPHGDIVGLVSTQAANLGTGAFDPYGAPITAPTGSVLGSQGDLTDQVTKQVDMGTRWDAPGLGRFASRDILFGELTAPMSLNRSSSCS